MAMTLDTKVFAGDLFDSLGGESEREKERRIEIIKSESNLEQIIEIYNFVPKKLNRDRFLGKSYQHVYEIYVNIFKTIQENCFNKITQSDINGFIESIDNEKNKFEYDHLSYTGLFISALMNQNKDDSNYITITKPYNYLGIENAKKLIILGDVGDMLGVNMSSGEILVRGNVKTIGNTPEGLIKGGKIEIFGNIVPDLDMYCIFCENGKIFVHGNIEGPVLFSKGELHVDGIYKKLALYQVDNWKNKVFLFADKLNIDCFRNPGEIYFNNTLCYKDGQRFDK